MYIQLYIFRYIKIFALLVIIINSLISKRPKHSISCAILYSNFVAICISIVSANPNKLFILEFELELLPCRFILLLWWRHPSGPSFTQKFDRVKLVSTQCEGLSPSRAENCLLFLNPMIKQRFLNSNTGKRCSKLKITK